MIISQSNKLSATGLVPRITSVDKNLTRDQRARLNKYYENLDAFEGYHFETKPVSYDDQGQPIDDTSAEVTINFIRRFVDKMVRFVLGDKGFTIDSADQSNQSITVPYLNDVWDRNRRKILATSMLRWGSVMGDVYVVIEPSRKLLSEKLSNRTQAQRLRNSLTMEELLEPDFLIKVIPAHKGFPYYRENKKNPFAEMIMFEYKDVLPRPREDVIKNAYPDRNPADRAFLRYADMLDRRAGRDTGDHDRDYFLYRKVYYPDRIEEWVDDKLIETYRLDYGLVTVVHIPNKIKSSDDPYGDDDISDVIPLNYELNYKASDVSEIINYYQSPLTIFFGVGLETIEKGQDRILTGLPDNAKVENLEMKGDLNASNSYISFLKESMLEVFGITQTSLTGATSISNTSGVALHMQYEPLMERKQEKTTYLEGIAKINAYIIYLAIYYNRLKGVTQSTPRDAIIANPSLFKTTITFPNTLPKDELLIIQKNRAKIESGMGTLEDALREMGEPDPIAKMKEIEADRMRALKYRLVESLILNIAKDGVDTKAFEALQSAANNVKVKDEEGTETNFATGLMNDPFISMLIKINNRERQEVDPVMEEGRSAEIVANTGTREMKQARNRTQRV